MVEVSTSLGRNGLQDWLIQRVSAAILALYSIFIFSYWLFSPAQDYFAWQELLLNPFMIFFTFLTLLALVAHAWIGIWTITTDYLKIPVLRLWTQISVYVVLVLYTIWGIQILWG